MLGSPAQGLLMLSFSHISIAGKTSAAQSENEAVTFTVDGVTVRGQEAIRLSAPLRKNLNHLVNYVIPLIPLQALAIYRTPITTPSRTLHYPGPQGGLGPRRS